MNTINERVPHVNNQSAVMNSQNIRKSKKMNIDKENDYKSNQVVRKSKQSGAQSPIKMQD